MLIIKNHLVSVICPSAGISSLPEEFIDCAYGFFKSKGLNVKEMEHCRTKTLYTAGSIESRLSDIHMSFVDNSIDFIIAFWGGRNSNQLIDSLDYHLIKDNPKVIMGYSDTTAILLAIYTKTGMITYYGPSMVNFIKDNLCEYTWEYFEKFFLNKEREIKIIPSKLIITDETTLPKSDVGLISYREGLANGVSIAGHTGTLLRLYGTDYLPDLSDTILFLEFGEEQTAGDIDRELTQIKLLGVFNGLKGIVFGHFRNESGMTNDLFESILDRVIPPHLMIPILYNANFGHTNPVFIIPIGGLCSMSSIKKNESISFTLNN